MKINPININNNMRSNNPNFKGAGGALIGFWDAIDRGGTVANFLVQDLASGATRTGVELTRNSGETGKLNYIAAGETAIREFTTSPAMFLAPAAVMTVMSKAFGSANNVPVTQIQDFSDIAKKTLQDVGSDVARTNPEAFRAQFYTNVMDSIKNANFEGANLAPHQARLDEIVKDVQNVTQGKLKKQGFIKKLTGKGDGSSLDEAISRIDSNFAYLKQHAMDDYTASFTSGALKKGSKTDTFSKLFINAESFLKDFSKRVSKESGDIDVDKFAKQFANNRIASRILTGAVVTAATVLTLVNIPKLYQLDKGDKKTKEAK